MQSRSAQSRSAPGRSAQSVAAPSFSWSGAHAIYPTNEFAGATDLSVSASGRAALAWTGGTPPRVFSGALMHTPAPATAVPDPYRGLKVLATTGTATGHFATPRVISTAGSGVTAGPFVAIASGGTAYVVWRTSEPARWVVAAARADTFARPRPLGIPASAQLQQLASAGDGPVAAVWLQYGVHSAPAYRYALLQHDGTVGRTVTLGSLGSRLQSVQFAINDRGAVAASWVTSGKPSGDQPRVSAVRCAPSGTCAPRQTIRFRHPTGQDTEVTTTLSDAGTAAVFITGYTNGLPPGPNAQQFGMQVAISRRGPFTAAPALQSTAIQETAAPSGATGAVVAYNIGGVPIRTLALSRLAAGSNGYTRPTILDTSEAGGVTIAGNPAGDFAVAWLDAPLGLVSATSYSLHATVGDAGAIATPRLVVPGSARIASGTLISGIDRNGDTLIAFNTFRPGGPGGVEIATLRS